MKINVQNNNRTVENDRSVVNPAWFCGMRRLGIWSEDRWSLTLSIRIDSTNDWLAFSSPFREFSLQKIAKRLQRSICILTLTDKSDGAN